MFGGLFSTCLGVYFLCVWGFISGMLGGLFVVPGGNFAGGLKKKVLKGREDKMSRRVTITQIMLTLEPLTLIDLLNYQVNHYFSLRHLLKDTDSKYIISK